MQKSLNIESDTFNPEGLSSECLSYNTYSIYNYHEYNNYVEASSVWKNTGTKQKKRRKKVTNITQKKKKRK
jgi:hypothetical protein